MKIGLTSDRFQFLPVPAVLALMRWTGVSFSEMSPDSLDHGVWCRRAAGSMRLALHLPDRGSRGFDMSSAREESRIRETVRKLTAADAVLKLEYALFHGPEEPGERLPWHRFVGHLESIPVPLLVENTVGQDLEAFGGLYTRLKGDLGDRLRGICLDIPHACLAGEDWRRFYDRFPVKVIHLSDCLPGRDAHLPLGRGILPVQAILQTIKEAGFTGILNLEILPPSFASVEALLQSYITVRKILDPSGIERLVRRAGLLGRFFR